ncbi:unnamed protein product, partial [Polarella glacialis]
MDPKANLRPQGRKVVHTASTHSNLPNFESETPAYAFRAELAKVTQPNRQLEAIKSELAKGQIAHSDSQEDTFETFRSLDFIPDEEDLARGCPLPTNAQS